MWSLVPLIALAPRYEVGVVTWRERVSSLAQVWGVHAIIGQAIPSSRCVSMGVCDVTCWNARKGGCGLFPPFQNVSLLFRPGFKLSMSSIRSVHVDQPLPPILHSYVVWSHTGLTHTTLPFVQYFPIMDLSVRSCKSGGIDTKIHGISVIGRVDMNEEEAAANFSFLSVEDMDGKDGGLIRKQRKMAEGSLMDSVSCKVFVWGLNDRQQLGSSQSDSKVGVVWTASGCGLDSKVVWTARWACFSPWP